MVQQIMQVIMVMIKGLADAASSGQQLIDKSEQLCAPAR